MSLNTETLKSNLRFDSKAALMPDEIINAWNEEQTRLKNQLILNDTEKWQHKLNHDRVLDASEDGLRYIAGLDLSYPKDKQDVACAGLVILDILNNFDVIYEDISIVTIDQPYVPGYLAFREVPYLVEKLKKVKQEKPDIYPHCLFIDGNGVLHPKRFGLACHLGVLTDTPSIGIAKKLFQIDGLENNDQHKYLIKENLKKCGDNFALKSNIDKNEILGYCYRTTAQNPIYVSIGHKICWETALLLVNLITTNYRIPEPTRQADLRTREYLRNFHKDTIAKPVDKQKRKPPDKTSQYSDNEQEN